MTPIWHAPWWIWVTAAIAAAATTYMYRRYARRSPSYQRGFHPANPSYLVRMYRLHRADEGKTDPKLLHAPLDRYGPSNKR